MKINRYIHILFSIPKSIIFNFRTFRFGIAIHLPILISYKTKILNISKNTIKLKEYSKKKYRIFFGFDGSSHIIAKKNSVIDIGKNANIEFNGSGCFAEGCALRCDCGNIFFGNKFFFNKNCIIDSEEKMTFGDNFLCGFECIFIDSDGHIIIENGQKKLSKKEIYIGNNVWCCGRVNVLKGTKIQDNSVIAFNSLTLKEYDGKNILLAGNPAKIVRSNIEWIH